MKFALQEKETCDKILQKYISFNTVDNKRSIVRALQDMGSIDEGDSDDMLEEDSIINSSFTNMEDNWEPAQME